MAETEWSKRVTRAWIVGSAKDGGETRFSFDAVIRESHHSELTVTDNPVETGVVISDHTFMGPLQLNIEADVGDVFLRAKNAAGGPVDDLFGSPAGRSVSAFTLLQELQRAANPFTIQTGLRLYTNMLLLSLDADQDAQTGNVLRFRANLREVIFVNTQTVEYPPRKAGPTHNQASKKVTGGEKKTTTLTAADAPKVQSQAFQATGKKLADVLGVVP